MNSYIANFAVYTFAMIGFIALALFVYKKTVYASQQTKDKDYLRVENTLRLSATKTVYVIKAGEEKFLIAGDAANTTMLAKLRGEEYILEPLGKAAGKYDEELPSLKKVAQRINNRG